MGDDEAYDYKFVKWMIKEKVRIVFGEITRAGNCHKSKS